MSPACLKTFDESSLFNNTIFQVDTKVEYSDVADSFPYSSPSLEEASFPKQFPFSAMVPKVYSEVREFILSCVKFSEDLNLSHEEIDETVRKATNILLTRTLSGCLSSLIRKDSLSLLQLIQIDINTYHLENTNVHLEKYISEITGKQAELNYKTDSITRFLSPVLAQVHL